MKNVRLPLALITSSLVAASSLQAQTTATTDPVGFVTIVVPAGTGAAKKTSLFSTPLLDTASITGQAVGQVTGVGSNTISNTNAGWVAGELSAVTNRFLIQITSGTAAGRMFLIATNANTTSSVTIESSDVTAQGAINSLGIQAGDAYKILPCDTLSSLFGVGTPTGTNNTVKGGTNAASADTIVLIVNGAAKTYFYRTSAPARWTLNAPGYADATHVPLPPYAGLQYARLASTPLTNILTGSVPTMARTMAVKKSGTTLISQFWPVDSTIAGLGLQNISGWQAGAKATNADTVVVQSTNGTQATYFYNGVNWLKNAPGFPISNTNPVALGSTIQVVKKGSTAGYSTWTNPMPYNLQ